MSAREDRDRDRDEQRPVGDQRAEVHDSSSVSRTMRLEDRCVLDLPDHARGDPAVLVEHERHRDGVQRRLARERELDRPVLGRDGARVGDAVRLGEGAGPRRRRRGSRRGRRHPAPRTPRRRRRARAPRPGTARRRRTRSSRRARRPRSRRSRPCRRSRATAVELDRLGALVRRDLVDREAVGRDEALVVTGAVLLGEGIARARGKSRDQSDDEESGCRGLRPAPRPASPAQRPPPGHTAPTSTAPAVDAGSA